MKVIETDRRRIFFGEAPEAINAATRAAQTRQDATVELARALLEIQRNRVYVQYGCSSVAMWARRLGLAPPEVSQLLKLASALEADSSVEERVQAKALTVPAAAAIAPLIANESLSDEHSFWLDRAQNAAFTNVRREARQRVAEIRCGEAVVEVRVNVPDSVDEDFDRATVIASNKAGRTLTRDETFEAVVDHYLDSFDPQRTAEGTRRTGDTANDPWNRYVPKSVKRAIRRRAGDRCEYPGCLRRKFLQFAHRRPWRLGSGRESKDLLLLCWDHHTFLDAEFVLAIGPTSNPIWVDNFGTVLTRDCAYGRDPETEREDRIVQAWMARREAPRREDRVKRCEAAAESAEPTPTPTPAEQSTEVPGTGEDSLGAGGLFEPGASP